MKRLLRVAVAFLCVCGFSVPMRAQIQPGAGGRYTFGTISTVGPLGLYIDYTGQLASPSNYTATWNFTGTAPTACTLQPEVSDDLVNWYTLQTTAFDCTTANRVPFISNPATYFRIHVLTYTAGDSTTQVKVSYTRGQ